jgi:hypothetical protein
MVLPSEKIIESTRQVQIIQVFITEPNIQAEVSFDLRYLNGKVQRCYAVLPVNLTQQRYLQNLPCNVWEDLTVQLEAQIDFWGEAQICITRIALNDMWLNPHPATIEHFHA